MNYFESLQKAIELRAILGTDFLVTNKQDEQNNWYLIVVRKQLSLL